MSARTAGFDRCWCLDAHVSGYFFLVFFRGRGLRWVWVWGRGFGGVGGEVGVGLGPVD